MRRIGIMGLVGLVMSLLVQAAPTVTPGQALVRFAEPVSVEQAQREWNSNEFRVARVLVKKLNIFLVTFDANRDVEQAVQQLSGHPKLLWAQADHIASPRLVPNDPSYSSQWEWNQATDRDIDAPEAWDIATGGQDRGGADLVVAIVDGGCNLAHPDLVANLWQNLAEVNGTTGADDDGNGYVDDKNGWDAYENNGSIPVDDHGTHVSGTVGARTNNSTQVAGVNWSVKLMEVAASSSQTSVISIGYGYVLDQKTLWLSSGGTQGANVVSTNSSFGVDLANCASGTYPVWNDLYNAMGEVGILSACATANANYNVDTQGDVPTSCSSPYMISVTNTTSSDLKNAGAAYGATTIDLGSPGTSILSTVSSGGTGTMTGTSMATPHVAGAVALMHAAASIGFYNYYTLYPDSGALALKQLLLDGTDPIAALQGITVSGGRLNLHNACLAISEFVGPNPDEPFLLVDGAAMSDAVTGNNNGTWERGETVTVVVSLENLGEAALNVNGVLSSADGFATVGDAAGGFGDIANGAIGSNAGDVFLVTLAPNAPLEDAILFDLDVTADSGYARTLGIVLASAPKELYYTNDVEGGAADWTHALVGGAVDQWHVSVEQAHSPASAWKCGSTTTGNYANAQDAALISPSVVLRPETEMRVWHSLTSEQSGTYADSCYDGGNVWISVNGGAWAILTPLSGYPKHFRYLSGGGNPSSGPQPGNACFGGTIPWTEAVFDLNAYADSSVQVRFRFSSDASVNQEGWYVDDIRFYGAPAVAVTPDPIDGLVIQSEGFDALLAWPPSAAEGVEYHVYMSLDAEIEPVDAFLVAQTIDTFFVHSGVLDTTTFVTYQVVVTIP